MKKLVPIPPESLNRLKKDDLKDFGYQFVSVKFKDGRVFAQAIAPSVAYPFKTIEPSSMTIVWFTPANTPPNTKED